MNTTAQRLIQALAASALVFGLAACSKNDNQTAGQKLDSAIANTDQAASNAAANASAAASHAADAAKNAAAHAEVAASTAAGNVAEAAKDAGNAVAAAADSATITASINGSLIKDPELSSFKIDVDTNAGVVTLTGEAPNQAAADRAASLAKATQGVTTVNNNLTIKAN